MSDLLSIVAKVSALTSDERTKALSLLLQAKAAAWEQVRGLQLLARQLQDQLEAVRKALG